MDKNIQDADSFLSAAQPKLDNAHEKLEYFPIQLRVAGRVIVVCGASQDSLAKVRLLLKTAAHITVYHDEPGTDAVYQTFLGLAAERKIKLVQGEPSDQKLAQAVYGKTPQRPTAGNRG